MLISHSYSNNFIIPEIHFFFHFLTRKKLKLLFCLIHCLSPSGWCSAFTVSHVVFLKGPLWAHRIGKGCFGTSSLDLVKDPRQQEVKHLTVVPTLLRLWSEGSLVNTSPSLMVTEHLSFSLEEVVSRALNSLSTQAICHQSRWHITFVLAHWIQNQNDGWINEWMSGWINYSINQCITKPDVMLDSIIFNQIDFSSMTTLLKKNQCQAKWRTKKGGKWPWLAKSTKHGADAAITGEKQHQRYERLCRELGKQRVPPRLSVSPSKLSSGNETLKRHGRRHLLYTSFITLANNHLGEEASFANKEMTVIRGGEQLYCRK